MIIEEDDYLAHYGILRRSGRYPWGSGGPENVSSNPSKRNKQFLDYVDDMRREGLSDVDIARGMGISTTALRAAKSIAKNEQKQAKIAMAQKLKDKGYSNIAIGERMGLNESSVRALLAPGEKEKADILKATSEMLKEQVAEKTYVDIGEGNENYLGISNTRFNTAVAILREEGYAVHTVPIAQLGTGKNTNTKVLAPPGTTWGDVMRNRNNIKNINVKSEDYGRTYNDFGLLPVVKINPDRVAINYKETGGDKLDGVMYVRPNVPDISLGKAQYAQVRVAVGDGHYLKGMAMYKNDLPDGVDILFNTNKSDSGNKLDAMKKISDDPDNPFGAVVDQIKEYDATGKPVRAISAMNLVNEEGDWSNWSKSLSSQMLSKQPPSLARAQLDMTYEQRRKELDEIKNLTNPTVKKKMLETFADETDSAAVHLKAAHLPRQASHVILPVNSIPETQIYAPRYRDGETVVLIRYPHGGTFEIPQLTVNNNHPEAKRLLGDNPKDAVGINYKVAERLSGADFDGDTVLVIPNNSGKVKSTPALEGLKNFDPKSSYAPYDGMRTIDGGIYNASTGEVDYGGRKPSSRAKQQQMGDVSNLITDMTIRGASTDQIARAVRHSMVVIDAEKHHLDYKRSAIENGIPALKEEYQGSARAGASTLISLAKSEEAVPERTPRPARDGGPIDKETGRKVYVETGASYVNPKGQVVNRNTMVKRLANTDDANTLSSGTPIERIYATHSNRLKDMANEARLEAVNTPNLKYSPSSKKIYENEVRSLNAQLNIALRNAPLERQAQIIANTTVKMKRDANPDMDAVTLKKVKAQALNAARLRTGAKKQQIVFTDREWEAIQAGAISDSKLKAMLANADLERVKELATPKTKVLMSPIKIQRAQAMFASGATRAEVADQLGVSLSTLDQAITQSE